MAKLKIGIMGAGAIGGYLGIRMSAAGYPVTLIGRASLFKDKLAATNLKKDTAVPGPDLKIALTPDALAEVDVCLLTVKSRSTLESAAQLQAVLPEKTPVISFQNGIRNVSRIQSVGLSQPVFAGMVTFNVARTEQGLLKGTSGPIMMSEDSRLLDFAQALRATDEKLELRKDMPAIQSGKLLLNLNNGVCAATGLHILETIQDRKCRLVFAACIKEGLLAMKAKKQSIAAIGILSPALLDKVLRLPDFVFLRLAKGMMTIDPNARSSTLQDLDRGRPTEIDDLNGEILKLCEESGLDAPANRAVFDQIKKLEAKPGAFMTPSELLSKAAKTA
jgi:2-dehydropantoate 2-reductase